MFVKKPFKDRLNDTAFLIMNSFTIVGKDKDIKTPTIHMVILSFIITTMFFSSFLMIYLGGSLVVLSGVLLLIFAFFVSIFRPFYDMRQKADQSWVVYNTMCGKDISYKDAHNHTKTEKDKLRFLALIDVIIKYMGFNKKDNIIIKLLLFALREAWDLLSHYMIPAVVIEQKKLKEIVPTIKNLKNNVPATLMGVFGIDFVGNVVNSSLAFIYFFMLAISIAIGFLVAMFTDVTVTQYGFSWVPVFAMLYIMFIFGGLLKKIVESIKVIYFTLFYTSITRPMAIAPAMRKEITNFLLMSKTVGKTKQQYIDQLAQYISTYVKSGYQPEQIRKFLLSKGYRKEDLDKAFKKVQA